MVSRHAPSIDARMKRERRPEKDDRTMSAWIELALRRAIEEQSARNARR
jgi:hypothetical protein